MTDRLSSQLLSYADELRHDLHDSLSLEEREEYSQARSLIEGIVKAVVTGREKISSANIDVIENLIKLIPDEIGDFLDEFYARISLEECHKRVERTLKLSALSAKLEPSTQTHRYISEATRAYVAGLDMASVAMSRAALEQALKERLGRQGDGAYVELRELIKEARKYNILGKTGTSAANEIKTECNALLHERPTKDSETAFRVLSETRSLLEEIYSADGGY